MDKNKNLIKRLKKVVKGDHWAVDEPWGIRFEYWYVRVEWYAPRLVTQYYVDDLPF